MTTTTKDNEGWVAGLLTAVAASLCCVTPVLALLGGASGLASSFSWIEPFRPYLIGLTVLAFAFAWYQKLKQQKQVDCDCEADNKKSFWQSKSFLGIATVVAALLIAFPYYAKGVVAFQTSYENANSTVKFDNSRTSIDSIAAAINSTGYKVVSQAVTNN